MALNEVQLELQRLRLQNQPNEVRAALTQLRSQPQPSVQSSVFSSAPEQFAVGAGKGVISTLKGASSLGERGIKAIGRLITPKSLEKTFGFEKTKETSAQQLQRNIEQRLGAKPGSLTGPIGRMQKAGFLTEQIAEFFLPGTAALKIGKVAETAVRGGRLAKGLTRLAATAEAEGMLAAGQTAIQTGELGEEARRAGLFGAAMPVVGGVAGKLLREGGKIGAEALGKTTGAGQFSIKEVFENPNVIKFAREAGADSENLLRETANQAKSALLSMRLQRSKAYQSRLSKLKMETPLRSVLSDAKTKVKQLKDSIDTIVEGENVVNRAIKDVRGWKDTSALGMDKLKQRLGSYSEQLTAQGKGKAKHVVDELKITVKKGLEKNVKGYNEMTAAYQEATTLIDDITRSLSLGKKNQVETAVRKFAQSIRRDDDTRREFLQVLSEQQGNDLLAQIAGAMLGRATPRGLSGLVVSGGAGITALASPQAVISLLPVVLATSPRLMGELINILGRITKPMLENQRLPVELQRALRQLILEMTESPK